MAVACLSTLAPPAMERSADLNGEDGETFFGTSWATIHGDVEHVGSDSML
jgi:hypothetical protein